MIGPTSAGLAALVAVAIAAGIIVLLRRGGRSRSRDEFTGGQEREP